MLLIGAVSAPWYVITQKLDNPEISIIQRECFKSYLSISPYLSLPQSPSSPRYFISLPDLSSFLRRIAYQKISEFWWKGMYFNGQGEYEVSYVVSWTDDHAFKTKRPEFTYYASAVLSGVALLITIFLFIAIFFGLVLHSSRSQLEGATRCCGRSGIKWIIFFLSLMALVLILVSWGIFIEFPDALKDAEFCPPASNSTGVNVGPHELWCDSFIGKKDIPIGPATVTVTWYPFIGWILAVVATCTNLVSTALIGFVKRSTHYANYDAMLLN